MTGRQLVWTREVVLTVKMRLVQCVRHPPKSQTDYEMRKIYTSFDAEFHADFKYVSQIFFAFGIFYILLKKWQFWQKTTFCKFLNRYFWKNNKFKKNPHGGFIGHTLVYFGAKFQPEFPGSIFCRNAKKIFYTNF